MSKYVFLLIFLLYGPFKVLSENVIIKGKIISEYDNTPVGYVNIYVKGTFQGTFSDINGNFQIELPKKNYVLVFYHVSFYKKSIKIHTNEADTVFVKVKLKEKTEQLGIIDVEAPREKTLSHFILNDISIRNAPAIGEPDAIRAVAMLPGIQIVNDYKAQPTIRGGSPDQTEYLLDGIEIYYPQHLRGIFSTFNIWALKDINIYTSYFPAQYYGKLSGIILCNTPQGNFISDKNVKMSKTHANISLLSSSVATQYQKGHDFFAIAFRRTYLDFITSFFQEKIPYYFYDGNFKWEHKIGQKGLIAFLFYKDRDKAEINSSHITWGNQLFKVNFTYNIKNFWQELTASEVDYITKASGDNSKNRLANKIRNLGLRYRIRKNMPQNISEIGIELKQIAIEHSWALTDDVDPKKLFYSGAPDVFSKKQEATIFRTYFSNSSIIKKDKIFLDMKLAGLLFNLRNLYASAGIELNYRLNNQNGLSFSAEKKFQFLAAGAEGIEWSMNSPLFLLNSGMSLTQITLGGYTEILPSISVKMEVYNKKIDKIARLNKESETFPDFEWGKGDAYGFDLLLEKRTGRITFQLGYSAIQNYSIFNGKKYYPDWFIPHSFKNTVGFRFGKTWIFSATTVYRSGLLYAKPVKSFYASGENGDFEYDNFDFTRISEHFILEKQPTTRFNPYFRLDVSLRKEYKAKYFKWYLYLQIFNVTNHSNPLRINWTKYYSGGSLANKEGYELNMPILPSIGAEFLF